MAALVGVVSVVGTFGIIDAGRRELGPSSLSTGRIAVGRVVSHIDDPFERFGVDPIRFELAERRTVAKTLTATSKGLRGGQA